MHSNQTVTFVYSKKDFWNLVYNYTHWLHSTSSHRQIATTSEWPIDEQTDVEQDRQTDGITIVWE